MVEGKLININSAFSVYVEVDDNTYEKLILMSDGESEVIEVTVIKCEASSPDIHISTSFEDFLITSINHDVEILSGVPKSRMVTPKTKIEIKVTTRVDSENSALFQD